MDCKMLSRERGDAAAADACAAEGAHRECRESSAFCPLYRLMGEWEGWGIPERERRLLRADFLVRTPLENRVALQAMRARLAGQPGPEGVKGTEALVVLGGKVGTGKTVAAAWALARTGGRYVTAPQFAGIGLDLAALKRGKTLVIDQLGTEPIGASEWALGNLLDVIDSRYANLRLTICCTNMSEQAMEKRYTAIFARRLHDDGVFIRVGDAA